MYITADIVSILGLGVAILAVCIAYQQLNNLSKSIDKAVDANKIQSQQTLLLVEDTIDNNRIKLEEASLEIMENKINAIPELEGYSEMRDILRLKLELSIDRYLRSLDRLCSFYDKNILSKEEILYDYKSSIKNVMVSYKGRFEKYPDSYLHIRKVYGIIEQDGL